MKQGIDADVASMTQAEKTMLRYQYVMNNAKLSMGDFAKTADTWANVVKTLKQQFQALGGTIGTVFINAFKPALIALRNFMQHVLDFAKTVADALGAIFGWTIEVTASGSTIAEDLDDAAGSIGDVGSGAGDAADGLGNAAGNAKELAKNLSVLPFDELNQLSKAADSSGGGGSSGGSNGGSSGGGGGGMSGSGANASLVRTESVLEKITSDIGSLEELGRYISETLTNALNSIPWDTVYEGARNFGKGLAEFLNGLITPELFGALGRTIANSLNTALYFLDSFGTTFNWNNFGNSIASGINEFFLNFDAKTALKNIDTFTSGIFTTVSSALSNIKWKDLATKLSDDLKAVDFSNSASALTSALNSAFSGFSDFASNLDYSGIGSTIATQLNTVITNLGKLDVGSFASGISSFASGILKLLSTAIGEVDWYTLGSTLAEKVVEFVTNIKWGELFKNATQLIGNIALGILQLIVGALEKFGQMLNDKTALGVDPGQMFKDFISNAFGSVSDTASDVVAGFEIIFSKIRQAWNEFLLEFAQDHPNIASFLGLDQEQLKLNIEAEITKQKDLRAEQDKHLPNTGDIVDAQDKTNGSALVQAAADLNKVDQSNLTAKDKTVGGVTAKLYTTDKSGLSKAAKTVAGVTAKYGTTDKSGLSKNAKTIGTIANFISRTLGLSTSQKTVNTIANFVSRTLGLSDDEKTIKVTARYWNVRDSLSKSQKTINVVARYSKTSNYATTQYYGGVFRNGKWSPITSFASGGSPYGGQIFRARENGNPELVGTLKGSTAVMNNNQIVASVSDGVAKAIAGIRFQMTGFRPPEIDMAALGNMIEYAVASAMANNSQPVEVYTTIKTQNDEVLARAVARGNKSIDYRNSAVTA